MSLRLRLIFIILVPLMIMAILIGFWALQDAQKRAQERFDRSLLSAALAISRDVAVSGGDAISPETNSVLRDTSGGPVFYHVFAPDGAFVTGYATPPIPPNLNALQNNVTEYFDGTYQGQPIRGLRFIDVTQIDGLSGDFTFTVWQDTQSRNSIVRDLSWRTFQIISSLVLTATLVIWFGVRFGLRPLLELEQAIDKRSADDLTPIKRKVPIEAQGIVEQLNLLFSQLAQSFEAKNTFISNAAHQLRNPIAGVVAMSEAVVSAKSLDTMRSRSNELLIAATDVSDLANKLLALERATESTDKRNFEVTQISSIVDSVISKHKTSAAQAHVLISHEPSTGLPDIACDRTMVEEALNNIIDNALNHGGPDLNEISVRYSGNEASVQITVSDDGKGIDPNDLETVKERFVQAKQSKGSGLGLAIASAVAKKHNGDLTLRSGISGKTDVILSLSQSG